MLSILRLDSLYLSFGAGLATLEILLFYALLLNYYNINVGKVKVVKRLFSARKLPQISLRTLEALNFWKDFIANRDNMTPSESATKS